MHPLQYHPGQVEVQQEANTRDVADHLAHWVGPAREFAERADLLVFAQQADGVLHFTAFSGTPPLVEVAGESAVSIGGPRGRLRPGMLGGLAINLGEARRVRLNGRLSSGPDSDVLEIEEAFTLCRKYLAPSVNVGDKACTGPHKTEPLALDDPWLADVLKRAETSFLGSISPDGAPDVAHRGGPPGFLDLRPGERLLTWPEYLGDGVFKSAGNVRATSAMTLVVPDLDNGDAVELIGHGSYTNLRLMRGPRKEPLVRDRDHFPIQGRMEVKLDQALRLRDFIVPRKRIEKAVKITSRSHADEQAPQ